MCLAVPGRIVTIESTDPLLRAGRVDFGGIVKEVNLAYVPEARVGDYVLVHVGFAISVIDEDEADHVFEYLQADGRARGARAERRSSMKYLDEYRDAEAAVRLRARHRPASPRGRGRSWRSAAARPTPS